jgi:hypothetical protein
MSRITEASRSEGVDTESDLETTEDSMDEGEPEQLTLQGACSLRCPPHHSAELPSQAQANRVSNCMRCILGPGGVALIPRVPADKIDDALISKDIGVIKAVLAESRAANHQHPSLNLLQTKLESMEEEEEEEEEGGSAPKKR